MASKYTKKNYQSCELRVLLVDLANQGMRKKRLSTIEVATRVGVSPAHLSSVLNFHAGASVELYDRILRAIRDGDEF